jgi:hypothetical protein
MQKPVGLFWCPTGWHTKPKPPKLPLRLTYRKRGRQERRPGRVAADSEDLRPSNPFYSADEGGTTPKACRDLRVTGSLRPPCQNPPFDRPEDLCWRNRRTYTGTGTRAQVQNLLHVSWTATQSPRHLSGLDAAFH